MSLNPNFHLSNPSITSPVTLQTQPGPAAETAYQTSGGEYFFQLASGGSANRNNFIGAVVIQDPSASLLVDGPIQGTQLTTVAIVSPSTLNLQSTGNMGLNSTGGNISVLASGSVGIIAGNDGVNITAGTNISVTAGAGSTAFINTAPSCGPTQIGNLTASSGQVTIAGAQVAFITDSTAVPMTVQYGVPGDTGYLYDTRLNPVIGPSITVGTYAPGLSVLTDGPFTVPHTGYYLLTSTIFYAPQGGAAVSFPVNTYFTACLTTSNASYIPLAGSAVTFSGVGWTSTGNAPVQSSHTSIVELTAGTNYYSDLAQAGSIGLAGNGSGVGFQQQIQALGCSYS